MEIDDQQSDYENNAMSINSDVVPASHMQSAGVGDHVIAADITNEPFVKQDIQDNIMEVDAVSPIKSKEQPTIEKREPSKRHKPKKLDPDFTVLSKLQMGSEESKNMKDTIPVERRGRSRVKKSVEKYSGERKRTPSPEVKKPKCEPVADNFSLNRSRRKTNRNSKISHQEEESGKVNNKCSRNMCNVATIFCSINVSPQCCMNNKTSRWYHISDGEHYCNECFDAIYRKNGIQNDRYSRWKEKWVLFCKLDPSVRLFISDQCLPFWACCNECKKWRQLPHRVRPTEQICLTFHCGMFRKEYSQENFANIESCSTPEAKEASDARSPDWLKGLINTPLLLYSPAAPFLVHYYPDLVGLSPSLTSSVPRVSSNDNSMPLGWDEESETDSEDEDVTCYRKQFLKDLKFGHPQVENCPKEFQPFIQPEQPMQARAFYPNIMDTNEQTEFPHFVKSASVYLAIRNLLLAVWATNCKEVLTEEACRHRLLCRGLARVNLVNSCHTIIAYLTRAGYINSGLLGPITGPGLLRTHKQEKLEVIILGAGIAGLTAARQLHNFGVNVCVLEAQGQIGGRILDNVFEDNQSVALGANILTGAINNPVTFLCHQCDKSILPIDVNCQLLLGGGEMVSKDVDNRMDFHFNAILDNITEWKKEQDEDSPHEDTDLETQLLEMHNQFKGESQMAFSEIEEKVFQFYLMNLEFACGTQIKELSALSWDDNEDYPQFSGDAFVVEGGLGQLVSTLAEGLDITTNTTVTAVDYSGLGVKVTGMCVDQPVEYYASRLLVAIPASVLKQKKITFVPELPGDKIKALEQIGLGHLEKVILVFSENFWMEKLNGSKFFAYLPESKHEWGLFNLFADASIIENGVYILIAHAVGKGVEYFYTHSVGEVVTKCIQVLGSIFPNKVIPEPLRFSVTNWKANEKIAMSYSFLPVGATADVYDILQKPVNGKLFFAGEATSRQFPQSVSGAMMSGILESDNIFQSL